MSKSTEVALPPLVNTPALEIDGDDVSLPRLYIGNSQSGGVQAGVAALGDIYTAYGKDDDDPVVLHVAKDEKSKGVLIHILGMTKGKSAKIDGKLESYAYDSPDAPDFASTTYNYTVALPEVEADLPYKFLLTRSGSGVARKINTVLKRAEGQVPAYGFAFRVTSAERKTDEYRWRVAVVEQVPAEPANVEIAAKLSALVAGSTPAAPKALTVSTDAPEI